MEYDGIEATGFQNYGHSPSLAGKYFSYTEAGAKQFAESSINSGKLMSVTKTTVSRSSVEQALAKGMDHSYEFFDRGGGNESIWFSDQVLDADIYPSMSPIDILEQFINGE